MTSKQPKQYIPPAERPIPAAERPVKHSSLRTKRRNRLFGVCLAVLCAASAAVVTLSLPMFFVSDIVVNGASKVSKDAVIKAMNLGDRRSIFTVIPQLTAADIERGAGPYLKTAKVSVALPDTLIVNITERTPRAYLKLPNMDMLVIVDEQGMALGTAGFPDGSLPVIVGMDVKNFTVGQYTEPPSGRAAFGQVMLIDSILRQNNISTGSSLEINLSKPDDIHLYISGVDVEFGSLNDANEKTLTAVQCIKNLPTGVKGFLDVKSSQDQAVFTYLK